MPRLRNKVTGAVMSVSDETADRLGGEWVDAEASARSESPDANLSRWKVAELKAYAEENGVDLGEATKKDDILALLSAAAESDKDSDGDQGNGDDEDE